MARECPDYVYIHTGFWSLLLNMSSMQFLCIPESPVTLYAEYSLSHLLIRHLISCLIQGRDGLLLISIAGTHSAVQASGASVKEVLYRHSTSTDLLHE